MTEPVLPRYGEGSLADVLPAVASHLGVGSDDPLGLPDASRYVVVLIDGLGAEQLEASGRVAPFLHAHLGRTLTSVAPSTTASALTSLGTGLAPGEHGIAGYTFRHPFEERVLNALNWDRDLSGYDVQPRLTMLERLAKDGVAVTSVLPEQFRGSGLTEAGLRGGRFDGVTDESDAAARIERIVDAAQAGDRTLVYAYERSVDHAGHGHGWRSDAWEAAVAWSDAFVRDLRAALPDDVVVIVTADHGMVDVAPRSPSRVVIEHHSDLRRDVDRIVGEGRMRQLFTRRPDAVAAAYRARLGDAAWVATRDEASDWFGPLSPALARRFGDVVVAAREGIVATTTMPGEFRMIGFHGSLTSAEMTIPLVVL